MNATITPQPSVSEELHTALLIAVCSGQTNAIPGLIDKGADVHFEADMLLDAALSSGHADSFWFLVRHYDFDLSQNWRVLRDAAMGDYKEVIDYLVQKNVDLNLKNGMALKNCCLKDQASMFLFLIEKGADSAYQDDYLNLSWLFSSFKVLDILLREEAYKKQFFSKNTIDFHLTATQIQERLDTNPQEVLRTLLALREYSEKNYQYLIKSHKKHNNPSPEYLIFLEKLECEWVLKIPVGAKPATPATKNGVARKI